MFCVYDTSWSGLALFQVPQMTCGRCAAWCKSGLCCSPPPWALLLTPSVHPRCLLESGGQWTWELGVAGGAGQGRVRSRILFGAKSRRP